MARLSGWDKPGYLAALVRRHIRIVEDGRLAPASPYFLIPLCRVVTAGGNSFQATPSFLSALRLTTYLSQQSAPPLTLSFCRAVLDSKFGE